MLSKPDVVQPLDLGLFPPWASAISIGNADRSNEEKKP